MGESNRYLCSFTRRSDEAYVELGGTLLGGGSAIVGASSEQNEIENGAEFIELNVSVDLKGIEQAIQRTNESLDGLALSLSEMAQNSDLTEEQKQNIDNTVTNINQLIDVSTRSVEKLPGAIEHSKRAVSTKTEQFLDDLQMRILIAIGAIVAALVAFIVAIFKLVLMPMQAR